MIYRGRHVNVSMRVPSGSSAIASRPVPLRPQSIMPQVVKLSHGNRSEDTSGSSRLLAELPLLSVGPRYQRTLHSDELVFWSRGLQRHALPAHDDSVSIPWHTGSTALRVYYKVFFMVFSTPFFSLLAWQRARNGAYSGLYLTSRTGSTARAE